MNSLSDIALLPMIGPKAIARVGWRRELKTRWMTGGLLPLAGVVSAALPTWGPDINKPPPITGAGPASKSVFSAAA